MVNHWATRDANGAEVEPSVSLPGRLAAANSVIGLLKPDGIPIVVGGDLNAFAETTEVMQLARFGLTDAFVALGLPPPTHCSDRRIDYLLSRGPIIPLAYNACAAFAAPSDHPFVVVTYSPR